MERLTTVACVLKTSATYGIEHVHRLRLAVARHHPGVRFVCLTDAPERPYGVDVIPLAYDLPGWWSKMEAWRPGVFLPGELVVQLDLDTVVLAPFTPLLEYAGNLAMMRDFNIREHHTMPHLRGLPAIGSAVIVYREGAMRPVWDAFIRDPAKAMAENKKRMDHFIRKHLPPCDYVQDLWPGMVLCAKNGFRGFHARQPKGGSLLCTWGGPRIQELPADHWYRKLWEGAA